MKQYKTVRDAKMAYDKFLGMNGDSHDGGHYVRPDRTKGPMVKYRDLNISVAVDREDDGWIISNGWHSSNLPPYIVYGLKSFWGWELAHA
jgi:hypothetical protein